MTEQITAGQFHAADGVEDWRSLYHLVSAHFRTGSLAKGIAFVDEIGRLTEDAEEQYLTVDLRAAGVTVSMGRRDIALARRISAAAKELDIPDDPTAVQVVNVTLDALVGADVLPFWRALLGYRQIGDDYLSDPLRRGPGFGLQQMDLARPQRNRMHLDVAVPHDQAETRISAALAAGGHPGLRHARTNVVGPGRCRGQRGLRRHLDRPRIARAIVTLVPVPNSTARSWKARWGHTPHEFESQHTCASTRTPPCLQGVRFDTGDPSEPAG